MSSGTWRGPGWRLFDADPARGQAVRGWLSCVIDAHPCPVDTDDAALVASELFGNAVTHGPGGRVLVAYLLWPDGARLIVCDAGGPGRPEARAAGAPDRPEARAAGAPGRPEAREAGAPGPPEARDAGALAESGRGLQVVDALSARWGTFRAARAQVVWCDLGQPLPAHAVEAWTWLSALLAATTLAPAPALTHGARRG